LASGAECGQYFWNGGGGQGEEKQDTSENTGDFARLAGVDEAVAENCDSGNTKNRSVNGADAAKDTGAAEDDRRYGIEFIAGPGVGFGLPEAGGVDDGSECGDETRENVC